MKNLDSINSSIEMDKQKNKKIIMITGIILAAFIVIILITMAILYATTDMFKSNKELFLKYMGQTVDEEKGFINKDMLTYLEEKETTPYNNEGTFSTNVTVSDQEEQEEYEETNNFNISFKGKTDKINSKSEQEINLNYAEDVSLPVNYKKIGDLIGIRIEDIANEYIAIDTSNTEKIFGVNLKQILEEADKAPDTIDITEDERKQIQEAYVRTLDEKLTKDKFSEVVGPEADGYRLTLKGEDIKNILISLLETTKNTPIILEKINEVSSEDEQISAEDIDDYINGINNLKVEDKKVDITVYCVKKKTNRITVEMDNGTTIDINKEQAGDTVKYNLLLKDGENETVSAINASVEYSGVSSQNVIENYTIRFGINNDGEESYYTYDINNNVNFVDSIEVEDFDENGIIKLTDYETEQVTNFFLELIGRINETSAKMLKEAEIEESRNPLLRMIPGLYDLSSSLMGNGIQNNTQETPYQEEEDEEDNQEQQGETENEQQVKSPKEEACEKINIVLKVIMEKLAQTTEISNEQINNLLEEAGLTQQNEKGNYASTGFTAVPEGDDNTVFAIKWTSTDGEEVIGGIIYDANAENKYQMKSAE